MFSEPDSLRMTDQQIARATAGWNARGVPKSAEARANMSLAKKGKPLSEKAQLAWAKTVASLKGKRLTEEQKQKLRKPKSEAHRQAHIGRKHSPETRAKMRATRANLVYDEAMMAKIMATRKSKPQVKLTCEFCSIVATKPMYMRYHGSKCRANPNSTHVPHERAKQSEECKAKIREAALARALVQHKCIHCGKIGQGDAMKRWHFDNCKHNPNKGKS